MKYFYEILCLILCCAGQICADPFAIAFSDSAEHAVLMIIDGFSYKSWDYLELPVLSKMADSGTVIKRNYLPLAAHPTAGAYAELHSGSIPNPIMMAGTVFITRETGYLQESFFPSKITAFVTNSMAYNTISRNYNFVHQKSGSDADAVSAALSLMEMNSPAFMRIHLQDSGGAGSQSMVTEDDVPWKSDIWAESSPYRSAVARADSLIGEFVSGLDKLDILEKTTIIILGEHGEHDTGWHPPEYIDSSITSMVLWGAGIKRGIRLPYSEHIDVTPTICELMHVEPPVTCRGRIITEALAGWSGPVPPRKTLIKEMLGQFVAYRRKMVDTEYLLERVQSNKQGLMFARLNGGIREQFYGIDKFSEWPRFNSIEELLEQNATTLENLDKLTDEILLLK